MTILKGGVDGFSYFSLILVILFSNQDHVILLTRHYFSGNLSGEILTKRTNDEQEIQFLSYNDEFFV